MKIRLLLLCLPAWLFCGCGARAPLQLAFSPHARTLHGTAQWRSDKKATPLHGEVFARFDDQNFAMTFSKGVGMTFFDLRVAGDQWQMHIVPRNMTLAGRGDRGPRPLAIWLQTPRWRDALDWPAPPGTPTWSARESGGQVFELRQGEFAVRNGRRVPTRLTLIEPSSGARLELKIHEIR